MLSKVIQLLNIQGKFGIQVLLNTISYSFKDLCGDLILHRCGKQRLIWRPNHWRSFCRYPTLTTSTTILLLSRKFNSEIMVGEDMTGFVFKCFYFQNGLLQKMGRQCAILNKYYNIEPKPTLCHFFSEFESIPIWLTFKQQFYFFTFTKSVGFFP